MNSDLIILAGNIAFALGAIMVAFMMPFLILDFGSGCTSKRNVFVTIIGIVLILAGFVMHNMPSDKDIQVRSSNTEGITVEETVASFPEVVEVTEVTENTVPYTNHTQAAEHGTQGGWA